MKKAWSSAIGMIFSDQAYKRTEEGVATMSGNMVPVGEESLKSDLASW